MALTQDQIKSMVRSQARLDLKWMQAESLLPDLIMVSEMGDNPQNPTEALLSWLAGLVGAEVCSRILQRERNILHTDG